MIKHIIFDLGGVILKQKATVVEDILSEIFQGNAKKAIEIWKEYESLLKTGKKTSDELIIALKNTIDTSLTEDQIKEQWINLYKKEAQGINLELLAYIKKLKEKYKVYLFTDTIDVHDEYNSKRGLYDIFDRVFRSCKEGVAKIEGTSAFVYLISKIAAKPKECVFIDDVEKYVSYAKKISMQGIVFKNTTQLKKDLAALSVIAYV